MKRTVEIVFSVIGAVLYGLVAVFAGIMVNFSGDPSLRAEFQSILYSDPNVNPEEIPIDEVMAFIDMGAWLMLISAVAGIILGIVSIVFLRGNKKPKAAGIILIVSGVITAFSTIGFALFASIAYVVAGIVALVRKPKQPAAEVTNESY
ncbi:DUF4064 domain-containing protein [Halobacillus sp. Marseille-Q1614]|uniref:DUF4064 domain-containing protein n=1 Tax=Halobacillus sp. Marseille-Q1614 TaxID=2709134 RepID=UPI00156FDE4E|nr:DUF4064 domain-containing protein [Halobacillus sp. Marseille-Q1614]